MNFIIKFSHMLLTYVGNITPLVTIFYSPMPYPSTFKVTLTYFQVIPHKRGKHKKCVFMGLAYFA